MVKNNAYKMAMFIRSLIIILVLFLCTFILINKIVYDKMKAQNVQQVIMNAKLMNFQISNVFEDNIVILKQMEYNGELIQYIREVKTKEDITKHKLYEKVRSILRKIEESNQNIYLAWLANETANFYIDSNGIISDEVYNVTIRPWYKIATTSQKIEFTQPYSDYATNEVAISCIKAVRENDRIVGFISVDISLQDLPKIMEKYIIGENGMNILMSDSGTVVFSKQKDRNTRFITTAQLEPYIEKIKANNQEYIEVSINDKEYFLTYNTIEVNNWKIAQLIDKEEIMKPFSDYMKIIIQIFLLSIIILLFIIVLNINENRNIERKLKREAVTDFLTQINNRKYFFENVEHILKTSPNLLEKCALFMIDIDSFKSINDTFGHDTGDLVLKNLAETLKQSIRNNDLLCRFGGDEFALLMVDITKEQAIIVANRIQNAVRGTTIYNENVELKYSISMGLSFYSGKNFDIKALIKVADEFLYEAKNRGRNRVCFEESCQSKE